MEIKLATNDPDEAADIVTAVVDAYMNEVVDYEKDQRRFRLSELDRIWTEKDQEVRNRRNELKQLAEQLGTAESETLNLKQKLTLEELAAYRQELARSEFDMGRLRSELASRHAELQAVKNADISDLECEMFAQSDSVLKKLIEEILWQKMDKDFTSKATAADEKSAEDKTAKSAEKHPADLEKLERAYKDRIAQVRDEIRRKQMFKVEKEIKRLEAAIEITNKQIQSNDRDVQRLKSLAEQFGSSSVDVEMLRSDIQNREKSLTSIAGEREKLKVELKSPSRVTRVGGKAEAEKRPPLICIP